MTSALTRRQFLAGAAALPFALRAMAETAPAFNDPKWVLLGTDKGKGIYRASWNALAGALGPVELAAECDRPSFFAFHPTKPVLYSANEAAQGDGSLGSFRVEAKSGTLQPLQQVDATGPGTCYVSVDHSGKTAFVANYAGGSMAAFPLLGDGGLQGKSGAFDCRNNPDCGVVGPVKDRQDAAHLHCAVVSPDNHSLLVCNLGEDAIEVFPIYPGTISSEVLGPPKRVAARSGSGPRHVAFHPNGRWVYCIHELDCTIDVYEWKKDSMTLLGDSTVSTLASEADRPGSTACEIVVSANGKFVYANTRGENSVVVYKVNPKTGFLTEQQRVHSGGDVTRLIAFDPTGRWLLCCNQGAPGSVTVFAHDPKTGRLGDGTPGAKPMKFPAETPMCVAWV